VIYLENLTVSVDTAINLNGDGFLPADARSVADDEERATERTHVAVHNRFGGTHRCDRTIGGRRQRGL
jgi:hypothetical protein